MKLHELPIVDTHQHLWDLSRLQLNWHSNHGFHPLSRNHLLDDYRADASGLNIVKTIYMEVDALPTQHVQEAQWILDVCAQADSRIAGAVIGARLTDDGFTEYLARFQDNPHLKGVRDLLDEERSPPGRCLQPEFQQAARRLGELELSFDIAMRPGELSDAAELAGSCPETRFIIDHCGGVQVRTGDRSTWKRGLDSVGRHQNVYCKISGFCSSPTLGPWRPEEFAPIVRDCFEAFGPRRVMFGSDWPVCNLGGSLQSWVEALATIVADSPEIEQQALFHDNAVRCYRLG
jgi:predicted TIM-barrel fold metal-dependent hydrolase